MEIFRRLKFVTFCSGGTGELLEQNPSLATCQSKDLGNNHWLVISTPLKDMSQNGNLPRVGVKIKNM